MTLAQIMAAERAEQSVLENLRLDARLAERSQDAEQIKAAKKAEEAQLSKWHDSYTAAKKAVAQLAADNGVTAADLRRYV